MTQELNLESGDFDEKLDDLLLIDAPTPENLEKSFLWPPEEKSNEKGVFDSIVFQGDDLYDVSKDSFRYGRMTTGTSYNLVTGKMREQVLEQVKAKDQENDETLPECPEPAKNRNFEEIYDRQMPKYFDYRSDFPEIRGIWTLLFDQEHFSEMSTFELQAAICAAFNSKHHMIICIGVDAFNSVTGVEMSAVDRVTFRMALTRAVAGEFQPPLVKIAPKLLTGVSPMKRDVTELTSSIDVLFVPVIGAENGENHRFLIVVRVKELSDKFYQLSSGRIYHEQDGRVVEMTDLNTAFHTLIAENSMEGIQKRRGSMFMLEPEPFLENTPIPLESCEEIEKIEEKSDFPDEKRTWLKLLRDPETIGWMLFGTAISYCFYRNIIKPLVK